MNSGIYEIKCSVSGKIYIGSSVDLKHRWMAHKSHLRANVHGNAHLQRAWNKYGEDVFSFSILQYCEADQTLIEEQKVLDEAFEKVGQAGLFNICKNSTAFRKGIPCDENHRAKISATMKGRPGRKHRPEVIEQISKTKRFVYEGFIRPDGAKQEPIDNLKQFCLTNGLDYTVMSKVYNGKRKSHKGWTHVTSREATTYGHHAGVL